MLVSPSVSLLPSLGSLDRSAGHLARQLVDRLRHAVASGALQPGERLPSTRTLANSLSVARGTVAFAYDQLAAEGYLEAQVGAGTRVSAGLDTEGCLPTAQEMTESAEEHLPQAAIQMAAYAAMLPPQPPKPFAIAIPSAGVEPDDQWRRLSNRVRATRAAGPAGYSDPRGDPALRAAIADHVRRFRGVTCTPEQIIVTAGTQQALFMAAQILLSPGDRAWIEEPCYPGLVAVLSHRGVASHGVPVDEQGFRIDQVIREQPAALAAFVTPSHQYPIGMPLSMARRQALVAWARHEGRWIVEDDYDSELRYVGRPFPAMQGMAPERVVYLGTFSKILFPSLRLGYVVAPARLVDAFIGAHALLDRSVPIAEQRVLAAYMREGLLEAHIRRIRHLYGERRALLVEALEGRLPCGVRLQPTAQGMHLLLWLPDGTDDVGLSALLAAEDIVVRPISPMYTRGPARSGLMLGFGGFPPDRLSKATERLIDVLVVIVQRGRGRA